MTPVAICTNPLQCYIWQFIATLPMPIAAAIFIGPTVVLVIVLSFLRRRP